MIKKTAIALLLIFISFLTYIYFSNIHLLNISGNSEINHYPYLRISISIILSVLILLAVKKKKTPYYFLNLLWLAPIIIILFKTLFGTYNTEKLDYLLGYTIDEFNIKQYEGHSWLINEITIKNKKSTDTIYVSENPDWEGKSYQLKDNKQSRIVKSWITGYYYVYVKKK